MKAGNDPPKLCVLLVWFLIDILGSVKWCEALSSGFSGCDLRDCILRGESNTIQAQEDITVSGMKAGNDPPKLYMIFGRFFIDISGSVKSFGLASFVVRDMAIPRAWIAAGPPRKSICEILNGTKDRACMPL